MENDDTKDAPINTRFTVTLSRDAAQWIQHESLMRACTSAELLRRLIDEARGAYLLHQRPPSTVRPRRRNR